MRAQHQQIGVRAGDLRQHLVVDEWRLLDHELGVHRSRHAARHLFQRRHEARPIGVFEHQRRKVQRRKVGKDVEDGQSRVVPTRDRAGVVERVLGGLGEINRAEDVGNANHGCSYLKASIGLRPAAVRAG